MKKISTLLLLTLAFFVFSAQNCKKRTPIEEKGSANNPGALGLSSGVIIASVQYKNNTNFYIEKAKVYLALTLDSLRNGKYMKTVNTSYSDTDVTYKKNPSARFDNLFRAKFYFLKSTFTANSIDYEGYADTTQGVQAYQPTLPNRITILLDQK